MYSRSAPESPLCVEQMVGGGAAIPACFPPSEGTYATRRSDRFPSASQLCWRAAADEDGHYSFAVRL